MITETLGSDLHRSAWIQTQLLKLYFLTTLYVDVKEPAFRHISGTKKTQLRADSNYVAVIRPGQN
jgi:hypothetical protein